MERGTSQVLSGGMSPCHNWVHSCTTGRVIMAQGIHRLWRSELSEWQSHFGTPIK
jgi:hypothetical protein